MNAPQLPFGSRPMIARIDRSTSMFETSVEYLGSEQLPGP
jgi:hypothetical protein